MKVFNDDGLAALCTRIKLAEEASDTNASGVSELRQDLTELVSRLSSVLSEINGCLEALDAKALSADDRGVPNGVAALDGNGKLIAAQMPDISVDIGNAIDSRIAVHNASGTAHSDIHSRINALELRVHAMELKYGTDVRDNQFSVDFASLDSVTVTGIWNRKLSRIEF